MTKAQEKLLSYINRYGAIPTIEEAVDIYVQHSLKTDGRCWTGTLRGNIMSEYQYAELKGRASLWLNSSIGSLVRQGKLEVLSMR